MPDAARKHLPTYRELMLPTVRSLSALGGSGSGREINDQVVDDEGFTDEQIGLTYDNNEKSVLLDRIAWARSRDERFRKCRTQRPQSSCWK